MTEQEMYDTVIGKVKENKISINYNQCYILKEVIRKALEQYKNDADFEPEKFAEYVFQLIKSAKR